MTSTSEARRRALRRALELAREGALRPGGGPFGAVVLRGEEILAEGTNEVTGSHDPTAHAEVVAIRRACERLGTHSLAGCEILSSCEPCPMCLGAIEWARLDRLGYAATREDASRAGFDDARLYEQLALPPGERTLPTFREEIEGAAAPFEAWLANEDRVAY
jgi:guanine deaminase